MSHWSSKQIEIQDFIPLYQQVMGREMCISSSVSVVLSVHTWMLHVWNVCKWQWYTWSMHREWRFFNVVCEKNSSFGTVHVMVSLSRLQKWALTTIVISGDSFHIFINGVLCVFMDCSVIIYEDLANASIHFFNNHRSIFCKVIHRYCGMAATTMLPTPMIPYSTHFDLPSYIFDSAKQSPFYVSL